MNNDDLGLKDFFKPTYKSPTREAEKDKIKEKMKKDARVRVSIRVPFRLHKRFKTKCVNENTNFSDVLVKYIEEYLGEHST